MRVSPWRKRNHPAGQCCVSAMAEQRSSGGCCSYLTITNALLRGPHLTGRGEMRPLTLALVFLCGVVCAGMVGVLRAWWAGMGVPDGEVLKATLGVLPPGADLTLMDEGYVAMALLGDHEDHQLTTKQTTELEGHRELWW
ncbi:hypothetical protein E2C01_078943 [Portunus trituberculatus]|uniref:Uncharacterized protein n=1 Tax=Portunus trituberculatus TaxID=210409 RepID=A0A5B7IVH6_PORTR|nr:hypothetical protein [Portunus trituberculatus]